ncbi:MAG TPA: SPOR domain-containing protein, partial [Rhizomicrobium sp.]
MPSFERGVYEPPNDDIRVFDDDEQDMDEEGSRLPLVIVIALLVAAAFAGVVWLAYSQGVQRGRSDAPRMIVAAPGPVKEAATDEQSGQRSLKIYQQPAPADDNDDSSPPPSEMTKPATPAPVVAKPAVTAPPVPKPAIIAMHAASKPETPALKTTPMAEKPVAPKPQTAVAQQSAPPVSTAAPAPLTPAPAPEAAKPKPEVAASAGGAYALQIGAYKSQADADAAWKAYQAKHPVAGGYSEDVRKADLGDKGIWYRLRIG